MAFYLVSAVPRQELMGDLSARLQRDEFTGLRPFGPTLSRSLKAARLRGDGSAVWEEEDYSGHPWRKNGRPCSIAIFPIFASSASARTKAGRRSRPCRVSSPSSKTDESHLAPAQSRTTYGAWRKPPPKSVCSKR